MRHTDPAEILHALDREVRYETDDRFCTIVALRLEDTEAGWIVRGSIGGHPLPVVARTDVSVSHIGTPGSLVGILDDPFYETFTHTLGSDEFLVMYTDGITEAKRGRDQFGTDRLLQTVLDCMRQVDPTPFDVTDTLVKASLTFQDGDPNDDIAVLTLRATTATDAE